MGGVTSVGLPDLAAGKRIATGSSMNVVVRAHALLERGAVDEGLEGRAGLAARLAHVVELLVREIAAADPGPDLAAARVHRHEAGLQHGALLARACARLVGERLQLRQLARHRLVGRLLQPANRCVVRTTRPSA